VLRSSSVRGCDTTEMLCPGSTSSSIRARLLGLSLNSVDMTMAGVEAGVVGRLVGMRIDLEAARFRFRNFGG
jgi:hypothetical protein